MDVTVEINTTIEATVEINSSAVAACSDGSAVLKDSANATISTTAIPSGAIEPITAPDGVVSNSNDTVSVNVKSNGTETFPDTPFTDSDGSQSNRPSGVAIVATPFASVTADFTVDDTTATTDQTLTFTDTSTGSPTAWHWDFGDGNTSSSQNPTHNYTSEGTYNVSLTVFNLGAGDSETKNSFITVTIENPPQTNLRAWYKAGKGASPSNMTLNLGNVSQWDDSVGGFHLTQATGSLQPSYTDALLNGYAGLGFSAHRLTNSNALFTRTTGDFTILVFRLGQANGSARVIHEAATSNLYELYTPANTTSPSLYNGTARNGINGLTPLVDCALMTSFNGANSLIKINDTTAVAFATPGTGSSNGFVIGSTVTGTLLSDMTVYEILNYTATPSAGDLSLILRYLKRKFEIHVPSV